MTWIESGCMHAQVGAVKLAADQGDLGEVRQQLTEMLRCAGQLACRDAVLCSDQAVSMLRSMVLPGDNED
jgi:hypothetical protein